MEEITFKKEFEDKLIKLGIKDKFVANFKDQKWIGSKPTTLKEINYCRDWYRFISFGFRWENSPEGREF